MTTTKRTIVDSISSRTGLSKVRSIEVLDTLLKIIKQTLQDGDKVLISGFGKFYVKHKSPRTTRDPNTGEPLPLEARRVVLFRYSQRLRDRINNTKVTTLKNKRRRNNDKGRTDRQNRSGSLSAGQAGRRSAGIVPCLQLLNADFSVFCQKSHNA